MPERLWMIKRKEKRRKTKRKRKEKKKKKVNENIGRLKKTKKNVFSDTLQEISTYY